MQRGDSAGLRAGGDGAVAGGQLRGPAKLRLPKVGGNGQFSAPICRYGPGGAGVSKSAVFFRLGLPEKEC